MTYTISVTNKGGNVWADGQSPTFRQFKTRESAEATASKWTAHIAAYNRVMEQNIIYTVTEVAPPLTMDAAVKDQSGPECGPRRAPLSPPTNLEKTTGITREGLPKYIAHLHSDVPTTKHGDWLKTGQKSSIVPDYLPPPSDPISTDES